MSTLFDSTESGWGETGAGVALDILGIATKGVAKDLFGLLGMAKTAKSVWDEKSAFEQDSVINEFLYKDDLFTNGDLFSGVKSDEAAVTRGNWLVDMIKSWVNGGSQTPREDLVKDLNAQIEDQNKNN